jgi:hypothetical protein
MQQPSPNRASRHFQTAVEPAALEFLEPKNLCSVRHGYQAAVMLAHMAEHFFVAGLARSSAKDASAYYEEIAASDEDFALLADVCNPASMRPCGPFWLGGLARSQAPRT